MALPTSGALSLNAIHVEAGGTSGTQCSMNDTDIRGLSPASGKTINSTLGTQVDFNNYYGASGETVYQMTGVSYIAYSTSSKTGGPAHIIFKTASEQSTIDAAWVNSLSSYNTSFSSYNNKAFFIEDYYGTTNSNNGPLMGWAYDVVYTSVRPSSTMSTRSLANDGVAGPEAYMKSGVYCKLYYSNSLIETWTLQQNENWGDGTCLRKVSRTTTSASYNVITSSRTTASNWRLDLHVSGT
ncbi:MAG: hypothetical protein O3A90_14225 [Proteobacteria bacterium]|nr:hypothetical protein [Pseudomonadota bacterium]